VPVDLICSNGIFLPANQPVITAGNSAFRFGEALFETMRFANGTVLLDSFHFDRLFRGLSTLGIDCSSLSPDGLRQSVSTLCERNGHNASARVRLQVYRDDAVGCGFLIETAPLEEAHYPWNDRGDTVDIFPHGRKQADAFSALKSANYLLYSSATRYAAAAGIDECLVLNGADRVCDGARTNIFLVTDGKVVTPPLSEGGIAGVMRRFVLGRLSETGAPVSEETIAVDTLLNAEAIFLTNAIRGIRWVSRFRDAVYSPKPVAEIYERVFSTMPPVVC
jgi:branched-chain amino acid aminotransferase